MKDYVIMLIVSIFFFIWRLILWIKNPYPMTWEREKKYNETDWILFILMFISTTIMFLLYYQVL